MEAAIFIPDDLFERAERLARQTKKSRSQFSSDAVREYIARHATNDVTEAMNRVCDELGDTKADLSTSAAVRRLLERSEW